MPEDDIVPELREELAEYDRDLSRLIDSLRPEEKTLVLEYFAGTDPEEFAVAVSEARMRYERADGYPCTATEEPDRA